MFRIRQFIKMLLQNVLLPLVYRMYAGRPVRRGSVIFADAHHETMPFSMERMYRLISGAASDRENESVQDTGGGAAAGERLQVETFICDFGRLSWGKMVRYLLRFMKQYATAEYVFICDYFLPAASCRKRPETTLVQLWHSCGLMKKIAHDAKDDIPAGYRGDLFGNYTWLTLSAEACVPVHARALGIPASRIRATGVSRTDVYFDEAWNRRCRDQFYRTYPEAAGKKIALWAPTFRGNAARPKLEGLETVLAVKERCEADWYFLIKAHPHVDAHGQVSNCRIPTEELLCVADVLITDYSSVLYDYLIYEKPAILFAPDLEDYERNRGFYIDYRSLPFPIVQEESGLLRAVERCGADFEGYREKMARWREQYMGACDGHASERIARLAGLSAAAENGGHL